MFNQTFDAYGEPGTGKAGQESECRVEHLCER